MNRSWLGVMVHGVHVAGRCLLTSALFVASGIPLPPPLRGWPPHARDPLPRPPPPALRSSPSQRQRGCAGMGSRCFQPQYRPPKAFYELRRRLGQSVCCPPLPPPPPPLPLRIPSPPPPPRVGRLTGQLSSLLISGCELKTWLLDIPLDGSALTPLTSVLVHPRMGWACCWIWRLKPFQLGDGSECGPRPPPAPPPFFSPPSLASTARPQSFSTVRVKMVFYGMAWAPAPGRT